MTNPDFKIQNIQKILNTPLAPIGVKIIHDERLLLNTSFPRVEFKKRFCYYVRLAAEGHNISLIPTEDPECFTPYLCLGFCSSEYVEIKPRIKPANTKAILLAPLQNFGIEVDSVLFIVNAKQTMLLVGALRRILKKKTNATIGASMSICGDIVVRNIVDQVPKLSFLCLGARIFSGYLDDELAVGIPFKDFEALYWALSKFENLQRLELDLKNGEVNKCLDLPTKKFEDIADKSY